MFFFCSIRDTHTRTQKRATFVYLWLFLIEMERGSCIYETPPHWNGIDGIHFHGNIEMENIWRQNIGQICYKRSSVCYFHRFFFVNHLISSVDHIEWQTTPNKRHQPKQIDSIQYIRNFWGGFTLPLVTSNYFWNE